jgi:AcrR family transcriptional regulator
MARPSSKSKDAPNNSAQGRRGRPTAARVAAIDAAIKAAALDLFVAVGFEAASMDAIAAAAKVSKGTLYARYPSKEPLFRAILEEQLDEWSRRTTAQDYLVPDELEPRLRHYARTIVAVHNWPEFRRIATLLDTSGRTFPDLVRAWDEAVTRRSLETLTRDMARAGGPGVDWPFFARLFNSAISGWHRAESSRRTVGDEEIIAFADKVIDVMLVSIRHAQALGG